MQRILSLDVTNHEGVRLSVATTVNSNIVWSAPHTSESKLQCRHQRECGSLVVFTVIGKMAKPKCPLTVKKTMPK